jgi:hypothetical protein
MFNRKKNKSTADLAGSINGLPNESDQFEAMIAYIREHWEENQIDTLINVFAATCGSKTDFMVKLSIFISRSLQLDYLSSEELAILGIDLEEGQSLLEVVNGSNSYDELTEGLMVRFAIKEYDKQIKDIIATNNLNPDKFDELRVILAKFAADNSITDLKAAYKFMIAVDPDATLAFK